jgi:hypothetical protein
LRSRKIPRAPRKANKPIPAWVSIESLAGEPLVLKVPDWTGPLEIVSGPKPELLEATPDEYTIPLKKGERITLRPAGSQTPVVLRPLSRPAKENHPPTA